MAPCCTLTCSSQLPRVAELKDAGSTVSSRAWMTGSPKLQSRGSRNSPSPSMHPRRRRLPISFAAQCRGVQPSIRAFCPTIQRSFSEPLGVSFGDSGRMRASGRARCLAGAGGSAAGGEGGEEIGEREEAAGEVNPHAKGGEERREGAEREETEGGGEGEGEGEGVEQPLADGAGAFNADAASAESEESQKGMSSPSRLRLRAPQRREKMVRCAGYHPLEDLAVHERGGRGSAVAKTQLAPAEIARTVAEAHEQAVLVGTIVAGSQIKGYVERTTVLADCNLLVEFDGDVFVEVDDAEGSLDSLEAQGPTCTVLLGFEGVGDGALEMVLSDMDDADDEVLMVVDEDIKLDDEDEEDEEESDSDDSDSESDFQMASASLGDHGMTFPFPDGGDGELSPFDVLRSLEGMDAAHPEEFAVRMAMAVEANPWQDMEQPRYRVVLKGVLQRASVEECMRVRDVWSTGLLSQVELQLAEDDEEKRGKDREEEGHGKEGGRGRRETVEAAGSRDEGMSASSELFGLDEEGAREGGAQSEAQGGSGGQADARDGAGTEAEARKEGREGRRERNEGPSSSGTGGRRLGAEEGEGQSGASSTEWSASEGEKGCRRELEEREEWLRRKEEGTGGQGDGKGSIDEMWQAWQVRAQSEGVQHKGQGPTAEGARLSEAGAKGGGEEGEEDGEGSIDQMWQAWQKRNQEREGEGGDQVGSEEEEGGRIGGAGGRGKRGYEPLRSKGGGSEGREDRKGGGREESAEEGEGIGDEEGEGEEDEEEEESPSTALYKLALTKMELIGSNGTQEEVELDTWYSARPDLLAHSAATIQKRANALPRARACMADLAHRFYSIQTDEVWMSGIDHLGIDLRVRTGIQVQTLRFPFRHPATNERSAERLLDELLRPRRSASSGAVERKERKGKSRQGGSQSKRKGGSKARLKDPLA